MNLICSRRQFCPRFILWFWKSNFQCLRHTFVDRIVLAYSLICSLLLRALKRTKLELACRNGDLELFVELRNIPVSIPGVTIALSWDLHRYGGATLPVWCVANGLRTWKSGKTLCTTVTALFESEIQMNGSVASAA